MKLGTVIAKRITLSVNNHSLNAITKQNSVANNIKIKNLLSIFEDNIVSLFVLCILLVMFLFIMKMLNSV
ncbi:MAG: hypothetical protein Phog2KO_09310 [Phototrophicaceae bacterium]